MKPTGARESRNDIDDYIPPAPTYLLSRLMMNYSSVHPGECLRLVKLQPSPQDVPRLMTTEYPAPNAAALAATPAAPLSRPPLVLFVPFDQHHLHQPTCQPLLVALLMASHYTTAVIPAWKI
jgi:hypothetical protein